MVIERMKRHWIACRNLRHGTDDQKRVAYGYLRTAKLFANDSVMDKALKNVETPPRNRAA